MVYIDVVYIAYHVNVYNQVSAETDVWWLNCVFTLCVIVEHCMCVNACACVYSRMWCINDARMYMYMYINLVVYMFPAEKS